MARREAGLRSLRAGSAPRVVECGSLSRAVFRLNTESLIAITDRETRPRNQPAPGSGIPLG